MNEKTLEAMMEHALVHGLDDLEVRMDLSLVMGDKRLKIMAVEGQPDIVTAGIAGFTGKWETMITQLQAVLDDQNKVKTTEAPRRQKLVDKS